MKGDAEVAEIIEEELPSSKRDRRQPPSKEEVDVSSLITRTQLLTKELTASVSRLQTAIHMEGTRPSKPRPSSAKITPKKPLQPENEEWEGIGRVASMEPSSSEEDEEDWSDDQKLHFEDHSDVEDDDGWESGSVDSTGQVIPYSQSRGLGPEDSDSDASNVIRMGLSGLSDDEDAEDISSASESPPKRGKKEASPSKPTKAKGARGGNVFLPSLSVGFLPGDDDPHDDWKNFDVDGPPLKKNRPGQRARRA